MAECAGKKQSVRKDDGSSEATAKPFDHPVYKTLSRFNGEVNRMSKEEIQERLAALKLDTR